MDSSRLLLGLMRLSRKTDAAQQQVASADALEGIISPAVLRSLLSALHFRDVATVRHARRVALLAMGMAHYLGWDAPQQKALEVAALLHDIGKIGVPDNILFKPGKLSPDEVELMALHHNIGIDVLQACRANKEVLEIVVQAHSQYDGETEGYRRASGSVHQGARILAVADAYDSLGTDQVYRQGKPHAEIMKVLMDSAGTQFDGNVVGSLARWIESEGLPFAGQSAEFGEIKPPRGPAHPEEALEASSLGHIFSYLYVLESLYDGFFLLDADLRFVVWNRGSEHLLGRPAPELLGTVWSSRLLGYADKNGRQLSDKDCPMLQVIADGKATTSMVEILRADGKPLEVELQSVPLLDQHGELHGVAEIYRDLSRSCRRPQEYRELKLAASRDALTSVANRGELETQLALMVSEFSKRSDNEPFSVIFLDVDFFKNINDTFGHTVGDQVLIDVARLLQTEMYSGELVGRYGGEEFVVLCPGTELEQAVRRAERLRIAFPRTEIGGMGDYRVTSSFGVTEAELGDSVESILRRADKALYMAKDTGRNKVCSLTNTQWLADEVDAVKNEDETPDPFVFEQTFHACVAADIIVYKLGGFVDDQHAKLVEVTQKRVVMHLGCRGLLPFWGSTDSRRPIELVIEFGDQRRAPRTVRRAASSEVEIKVRIRPIGWIRNADVFNARATQILKTLRSHFVVG